MTSAASTDPSSSWRSLAISAQPMRVFFALAAALAAAFAAGQIEAVPALLVGVVASAVAETDDGWRGRLRAQLATLACLACTALIVELVFAQALIFGVLLAAGAFGLTLLGAANARYRNIAFAGLLVALYLTLDADEFTSRGESRWQEPMRLLAGAAWYGVVSVVACALFSRHAVQAMLVQVYGALGRYLDFRSSLLDPDNPLDATGRQLALAKLNAEVVASLNVAAEAIFARVGTRPASESIVRYRALYLVAQGVHERACALPQEIQQLPDDELARQVQALVALEARVCDRLAGSIDRMEPFVTDGHGGLALARLAGAVLRRGSTPPLDALVLNLERLDGQLGGAGLVAATAASPSRSDLTLYDRAAGARRDEGARFRRQRHWRSPVFGHAVRLALALCFGWAATHALHTTPGGWLALAIVLVCQPAHGDTVRRLGQRAAGTVAGMLAGSLLAELVPEPAMAGGLAVAAGALYFFTRDTRPWLASTGIAGFMTLCFLAAGADATLDTLFLDSLVGSAIAIVAVMLVFPHWRAQRARDVAALAAEQQAAYLRHIVEQYRSGPRDDLAYRLARRNAHNADAALSIACAEMASDPEWLHPHATPAQRFLADSHALLDRLSALAIQRMMLRDLERGTVLRAAADRAAAALDGLADDLRRGVIVRSGDTLLDHSARESLDRLDRPGWETESAPAPALLLVRDEVVRIWAQVDALRACALGWVEAESGPRAGGSFVPRH